MTTDVRRLALTAINDAASRGANVDKARKELSSGGDDVSAAKYEQASSITEMPGRRR